MRLWLSEKAARAMKNLPPEDYVQCEQHGRQRYARTPKEQEEAKGAWMCAECLKALESQQGAARSEQKKKEDEEREARKAAKKAAKGATGQADDTLAEALQACKELNRKVRETQHRLRERRKDLDHGPAAIAEAEEKLREAQRVLDEARRSLERGQQEVPALETQLGGERDALNQQVVVLEKSLDDADGLWKAVPPRDRKRRDRRTRHAAVQIVLANRRWRERQAGGAQVLPEDQPDLEAEAATAPLPEPSEEGPVEETGATEAAPPPPQD